MRTPPTLFSLSRFNYLPEFPTETGRLSPYRYEDDGRVRSMYERSTENKTKRHPSTNRAQRRVTKPSLRAVYGRTPLVRHDVAAIPRLTLRKPLPPCPTPRTWIDCSGTPRGGRAASFLAADFYFDSPCLEKKFYSPDVQKVSLP